MRPASIVLALGAFAPTSILGAPRPEGQSLAQAGSLLKRLADGARLQPRQDISGGIAALTELAQDVAGSASTGKCRSQCRGWTEALTVCTDTNSDTEAIGRCGCARGTLSKMSPCATCFGSVEGYTSFENLCEYLITGTVPSSSESSAASSISSASSASASDSASPTSQTSDAATRSAPKASVATTRTQPIITSAPTTTAGTNPAVTSAAGAATSPLAASSANGRVDLVAGSVIGTFAFLFALIA